MGMTAEEAVAALQETKVVEAAAEAVNKASTSLTTSAATEEHKGDMDSWKVRHAGILTGTM